MKFTDYCLVLMGEIDMSNLPNIFKMAESKPNTLDSKGVIISTFTSVMEISEITEYLKSINVNFMVFKLNNENTGVHFLKKEVNEGLFGFLDGNREQYLQEKSNNFMYELTGRTADNSVIHKDKEDTLQLDEIETLTKEEKNDWFNSIIDKGVDNLSEYDKELLSKLANSE